jgi:hypothetical protein
MHLLQPLARLRGRLRWGLTPWRKRGVSGFAWPREQQATQWSERWQSAEDKLRVIEQELRGAGACVLRGGDFDRWDLTVRAGMLGAARLHMTVEEHGGGKQLARFRARPKFSFQGLALMLPFVALAALAVHGGALVASVALTLCALCFALRSVHECAAAMSTVMRTLRSGLEQIETQETAPLVAQTSISETVAATPAGEPTTATAQPVLAMAAGAGAGREAVAGREAGAGRDATVPPSAVSSVGSSLFHNRLPFESSSGVTELSHHRLLDEE